MKTTITILITAVVAFLTLGFVYPNEAPVYDYSAMLNSFYILIAVGIAAVGLVDLKNKWEESRIDAR